jgi:cytochrome c7-like protein
MPALFTPRSNRLARGALVAAILLVIVVPVGLMIWVRTPAVTGQGRSAPQPIPFDHRVHVTALRIDCRYCHFSVERAATAGMPSSQICLPCHTTLWRESSVFAPVRHSISADRPIAWRRINGLPDFVFFNHAIHVKGGIACETCHGRVDRMGQVQQAAPLTMGWCISCHRDPEPHRRPADAVVAMGWRPGPADRPPRPLGAARIREITSCSACHR